MGQRTKHVAVALHIALQYPALANLCEPLWAVRLCVCVGRIRVTSSTAHGSLPPPAPQQRGTRPDAHDATPSTNEIITSGTIHTMMRPCTCRCGQTICARVMGGQLSSPADLPPRVSLHPHAYTQPHIAPPPGRHLSSKSTMPICRRAADAQLPGRGHLPRGRRQPHRRRRHLRRGVQRRQGLERHRHGWVTSTSSDGTFGLGLSSLLAALLLAGAAGIGAAPLEVHAGCRTGAVRY